jgi:hypothetical protein
MTDRLSSLLHDEATALDVPAVPADRILAQGRGLQRRRRTTTAVAGAVAAVLVAAIATTAVSAWRGDDSIEPASRSDQAAYQQKGAWAVGDEVHLGNHVVTVPYTAELRYTSLGVLVYTADLGATGDEKPFGATLVTPDGEPHAVEGTGLDDLAVPPGTDPAGPYIAYARPTDSPGHAELVVLDLRSGDETVVGEPFRSDHPERTTVTIDGDTLVWADSHFHRLDWRTGDEGRFDPHGLVSPFFGTFPGGNYVATAHDAQRWQVRSAASQSLLLEVPVGGYDGAAQAAYLSPDGKYLMVSAGEDGILVYAVATGASVLLGGGRGVTDYGWTPNDQLVGKKYAAQASEVELCDPDSGRCRGTGETRTEPLTLARDAGGIPI